MNADAKKRAERMARDGLGVEDIMLRIERAFGKRPFRKEVRDVVNKQSAVADMFHVRRINTRWPNAVPTAAAKLKLIAAESLAPWTNIEGCSGW